MVESPVTMADDIIERYSNLHLEDEETDLIDLSGVESPETDGRVSLMLVGRLLTDRAYNFEAFKRTMCQVWGLVGKVIIRTLGSGKFLFQFFHWREKEKVMMGRPWCFEQSLLILNEVIGNEQPMDVVLNKSPFWVRIENLPFNCRSDAHVREAAINLGEMLEIEEDILGIEKDRRIRVLMDVSKPLRRTQKIVNREGRAVRVNFKYERLPFFCFMCGMMGHSDKDCLKVPEEQQKRGPGWSVNLKASPRKGRMHNIEEVKEITAARRTLFVPKPNSVVLTNVDKKDTGEEANKPGRPGSFKVVEEGGKQVVEEKERSGEVEVETTQNLNALSVSGVGAIIQKVGEDRSRLRNDETLSSTSSS